MPWEIEASEALPAQLRERIHADIQHIREIGFNTIRLWGAPKAVYQEIKSTDGLQILQTLWVDSSQPDLLDSMFITSTKSYFRSVIDRIYSVYNDKTPPVCGYIIGNEISRNSMSTTGNLHPGMSSFHGNYIDCDSVSAAEYFLAELGDFVKTYINENYGDIPLVTYANQVPDHDWIDAPFLDFRSFNVYSYAITDYIHNLSPGSVTGTHFQGCIEFLKNQYPDIPLLITEAGLSVSPNATHTGPPDYGYGGNTEDEQAAGLMQNLEDVETAETPMAGMVIHEYLDAWWKNKNNTFEHDPNDVEEWFGVVRLEPLNDWYTTSDRPIVAQLESYLQ